MSSTELRYGLIAGNGLLPVKLVERLGFQGQKPIIVGIEGECQPELIGRDCVLLPVEKIAFALPILKKAGANRVIFAGGVKRRPKPSSLRVPMSLWLEIPSILVALGRGDDSLLVALVNMFERHGMKIIGAHEVLPDHVAPNGVIAGAKPKASIEPAIRAGILAATIIGAQDIGQAVVAMGRRVIAVEGIEGTDQMLARVAALRAEGRIQRGAELVLVKLAKPKQELRADMPVIGPTTIEGCKSAGITLICISAGSTLMMDVAQTLEQAKSAGLSIFGVNPEEWGAP